MTDIEGKRLKNRCWSCHIDAGSDCKGIDQKLIVIYMVWWIRTYSSTWVGKGDIGRKWGWSCWGRIVYVVQEAGSPWHTIGLEGSYCESGWTWAHKSVGYRVTCRKGDWSIVAFILDCYSHRPEIGHRYCWHSCTNIEVLIIQGLLAYCISVWWTKSQSGIVCHLNVRWIRENSGLVKVVELICDTVGQSARLDHNEWIHGVGSQWI